MEAVALLIGWIIYLWFHFLAGFSLWMLIAKPLLLATYFYGGYAQHGIPLPMDKQFRGQILSSIF